MQDRCAAPFEFGQNFFHVLLQSLIHVERHSRHCAFLAVQVEAQEARQALLAVHHIVLTLLSLVQHHGSIDDPFIVLTETKFSFRCIPVGIGGT